MRKDKSYTTYKSYETHSENAPPQADFDRRKNGSC